MKTCKPCGHTLPLHAFNRDRNRPDGRFPYCKLCRSGPGAVLKVVQWRACATCRTYFKPRHNRRVYVRHCSIACAPHAVGPAHPYWKGDDVGYYGVHQRVAKAKGAAPTHQCQRCDRPAAQWSYDRTDPDERPSRFGPYSTDVARYVPLCISCHKRFDLAAIKAA